MTVSSDNLIEIIKGLIPIVESHIRIGESMFSNPDPGIVRQIIYDKRCLDKAREAIAQATGEDK